MNQEYISALKSERLPLFLVYIDNIYGLRAEILNKTSALMFTRDILYIYFFHLLSSRLYAVFRFFSLRDRIFILFLLMNIYF
jgi:hypothetical protein